MSDQLVHLHNAIETIHAAVLEAIHHADTNDRVLGLHDFLTAVASRARDWKKLAEQRFIEHIEQHGEVVSGTVRYYVGKEKKVKARDQAAVLDECLTLSGGDTKQLSAFLSSGAFKHGAVRLALEEAGRAELFEGLFDIIEELDLKTGKARKVLGVADDKYAKSGI